MSDGERNAYVISNRVIIGLIVAWVGAFACLPLLLVVEVPQAWRDTAFDVALSLFVVGQAIKLIALGERLTRRFG